MRERTDFQTVPISKVKVYQVPFWKVSKWVLGFRLRSQYSLAFVHLLLSRGGFLFLLFLLFFLLLRLLLLLLASFLATLLLLGRSVLLRLHLSKLLS